MVAWCEDNVHVPITLPGDRATSWCPMHSLPTEEDEYGRSYANMWAKQSEILKEALAMENGEFLYTLIVLCWPRGEGKSLVAVLILMWKFFCFIRQLIMPAANSKDQIEFAHYEWMLRIIRNSPNLFKHIGGEKNLRQKEIRITKGKEVISYIRCITNFSGLKPNMTGYSFSEMFAMKRPEFFFEIDGSTRATPNALGVIDSTVSTKQHVLYHLFETFTKGKDPTLFFSYRSSHKGSPEDYWNPYMTKKYLDSRRERFLFGAFERFFLNLWDAAEEKMFTDVIISAAQYFGVDKHFNNAQLMRFIEARNKILRWKDDEDLPIEAISDDFTIQKELSEQIVDQKADKRIRKLVMANHFEQRLWRVDDVYSLIDDVGQPTRATIGDLQVLSAMFDTNWCVCVGGDRADPTVEKKTFARTPIITIAKGLPGSRSRPTVVEGIPNYIYILLWLRILERNSAEEMKEVITASHEEYDGVDSYCAERWGMWDLGDWCVEKDIQTEIIYPSYTKQREAFSALFLAYKYGRFKAPATGIHGSKMEDIMVEEPSVFEHIEKVAGRTGWFGSPEKDNQNGIQDDVMYALAWAMYGGRNLTIGDFRPREGKVFFGQMFSAGGHIGKY